MIIQHLFYNFNKNLIDSACYLHERVRWWEKWSIWPSFKHVSLVLIQVDFRKMNDKKHQFILETGSIFLDYILGPCIGQGAFGELYAAIEQSTGILWAIKAESQDQPKKTLAFEFQILAQIQSSPHFPRLGKFGRSSTFQFYTMELLGPSISSVLRHLPGQIFTISTAIRCSFHILKCIEAFHTFGFVHRDIKPGNILTREGCEHPLCLIDYGLSRVYVNSQTGKHIPQRFRVGFRGTKAYASVNAHMYNDLSRRDDLFSWFYLTLELLFGKLPWKGIPDKSDIFRLKIQFDCQKYVGKDFQELVDIYTYINTLGFEDLPKYSSIYSLLNRLAESKSVDLNEEGFDWSHILHEHRQKVAHSFEELRPTKQISHVEEVNFVQEVLFQPLLGPNMTVDPPFSQVIEEESCCGCC